MVALLAEHPKLVILFVLIGTLIGLWHLGNRRTVSARVLTRLARGQAASARR